MKQQLAVLSLISLFMATGLHAETAKDLKFSTIRQKAMGGVAVGISKDEGALIQNPAGLSQVKRTALKFPRIQASIGENMLSQIRDIQDLLGSDGSNSEQTQALIDLAPLEIATSWELTPALSFMKTNDNRGIAWGFGAFLSSDVTGELRNAPSPVLELTGSADTIMALGLARYFSLFDRNISVGLVGKYITRSQIYDQADGSNTLTFNTSRLLGHINGTSEIELDTYTLTGMAFDLGFLAPIETLNSSGSWGLVFRNIGGSLSGDRTVNGVEESGDQTLPFTTTFGVAFNKNLPVIGDVLLAADYDIISPDNAFGKKIHMGIEKGFLYDRITLRGGLNQGFIVGGVGMNLWILHLDYAFYAEELGEELGLNSRLSHVIQVGVLF